MQLRIGGAKDIQILEEMLFEAIFWNPCLPRPTLREFFGNPDYSHYVEGWGRAGDTVVVAEENGQPVGAAWYRFWFTRNQSHGFVDRDTPVLAIAVQPEHRSKGIGRQLLRALIAVAKSRGLQALSLAVEPDNFARALYESEGFQKVGKSNSGWVYVLHLDEE